MLVLVLVLVLAPSLEATAGSVMAKQLRMFPSSSGTSHFSPGRVFLLDQTIQLPPPARTSQTSKSERLDCT